MEDRKMFVSAVNQYINEKGKESAYITVRDKKVTSKLFASAGVKSKDSVTGTIWLGIPVDEARSMFKIGMEIAPTEARWTDKVPVDKETGEELKNVLEIEVL